MKRWCWPSLAVALLLLLAAFSRPSGAGPDLAVAQPFMSRAEIRQQGAVTVRAAVLTDDESKNYFGASLADHGIQAVWLSVDNGNDLLLRFLPIVTDPNYFSGAEVARLLHVWWWGSANAPVEAVVARRSISASICRCLNLSAYLSRIVPRVRLSDSVRLRAHPGSLDS